MEANGAKDVAHTVRLPAVGPQGTTKMTGHLANVKQKSADAILFWLGNPLGLGG